MVRARNSLLEEIQAGTKECRGERKFYQAFEKEVEGSKLSHSNEKVTFTVVWGLSWTEGWHLRRKRREEAALGVERA